jgi:hypothetical protein
MRIVRSIKFISSTQRGRFAVHCRTAARLMLEAGNETVSDRVEKPASLSMAQNPEESSHMKRKCFVVMPFGERGTEKHRRFWNVYEYLIKEALTPLGYTCERGDEIPDSGVVPDQIKDALRDADLVVADLTDRNPNVMYEVGVRHALRKPIVLIAQDVRGLPFDVSHYRTIAYQPDDLESSAQFRKRLVEQVLAISGAVQPPIEQAAPTTPEQMFETLNEKLRVGLDNVYRVLVDVVPQVEGATTFAQSVSAKLEKLGDDSTLRILSERVQTLVAMNQLHVQLNQLGLVGVHKNRLDAIEHHFFEIMSNEPSAIDIVGSTIFGLKGYRSATFEKIVELLARKNQTPGFRVRILLTHWDYISYRQDQEITEKNAARYVISKELKDAMDVLDRQKLTSCVKFYMGSPTCFTIICDGQKQMLMNPYPYQREAYNSWCIVVRDTFGGVYSDFKAAHFDEPWSNPQLTIPYDDACRRRLAKKLEVDIGLARQQLLGQLSSRHIDDTVPPSRPAKTPVISEVKFKGQSDNGSDEELATPRGEKRKRARAQRPG